MFNLGFSPCPNDTYIFYALAEGIVSRKGFDLKFFIEDVETLNNLALSGELHISKVSCHAFFFMRKHYHFLRCGGAFGRRCGPLIVSKGITSSEALSGSNIAVPGIYTTALLLMRLFTNARGISLGNIVSMPFHEIMRAVQEGSVDAGLIIHEGRFTFKDYGLTEVADLGSWWEEDTGLPIPLGGIVVKKTIGDNAVAKIEDMIIESLRYSDNHIDRVMPYIKRHAQELSEEVIRNHIALYVNDFTRDIGTEGRMALEELMKRTEGVMR